jgi:hypothetical protein
VTCPFDNGGYHFSVCRWNVNGQAVTDIWIQELYASLVFTRLDVLFLLDTRTPSTEKAIQLLHYLFRRNMNEEWMFYITPARSSGVPGRNKFMGGVIMLVCKRIRLGWTVSNLYLDPSGCSHFLAADLHQSDGCRVRVVGVYLPTASSDKESILVQNDTPEGESNIKSSALATKLRQYLALTPGLQQYPTAESWLVPHADFHC